MAPRNSRTKIYRKYRNSGNAKVLPYIHNPNCIYLDPVKAVGNEMNKAFIEYKNQRTLHGLDCTSTFDNIVKSDEESDTRYVNSKWYQSRQKGDPNAWE